MLLEEFIETIKNAVEQLIFILEVSIKRRASYIGVTTLKDTVGEIILLLTEYNKLHDLLVSS